MKWVFFSKIHAWNNSPSFHFVSSILIWCEQCIWSDTVTRAHTHTHTHTRTHLNAHQKTFNRCLSHHLYHRHIRLCSRRHFIFSFRMLTFKLFVRHALEMKLLPILWIFPFSIHIYCGNSILASCISSYLCDVLFSSMHSNCIIIISKLFWTWSENVDFNIAMAISAIHVTKQWKIIHAVWTDGVIKHHILSRNASLHSYTTNISHPMMGSFTSNVWCLTITFVLFHNIWLLLSK